jgi:hypothetical protein
MKLKIALIIISLLLVRFVYNNFFLPGEIPGVYNVEDYDDSHSLAEMPNDGDTLKLYEDGHFESGFYGEGTYEISSSLGGTAIDLKYQHGKAGVSMHIERRNWGKPKIMVNIDLDEYYEKID